MQGAYPAPIRGRLLAAARMAMAVAALITAPIAGLLLDVVGHGPILAGASVVGMLAMAAFAGIKSSDPRPFRRRNPWALARGAFATPFFSRVRGRLEHDGLRDRRHDARGSDRVG